MPGRMFDARRRLSLARSLFSLLTVLVLAGCALAKQPESVTDTAIRVENMMARPALAGQNSAAYFTLLNPTSADDRLLSVTGDVAAAIELYETVNDNGVMRMTPHAEGFVVAAGAALELTPGGKHVMLMDLRQELRAGQEIVLLLTFAQAGAMQVTFSVMDK